MIESMLKQAHDGGAEVLVQIRESAGGEQFRGRIQTLEAAHFTLFHSGPGGGVLWAFPLADVAHCGIVLELPPDIAALDPEENAVERGRKQS